MRCAFTLSSPFGFENFWLLPVSRVEVQVASIKHDHGVLGNVVAVNLAVLRGHMWDDWRADHAQDFEHHCFAVEQVFLVLYSWHGEVAHSMELLVNLYRTMR